MSKTSLLCLCIFLSSCAPKPASTTSLALSGDFYITWQLESTPRSLDILPVTVRLTDKRGQPISGALVSTELSMPSMSMPENKIMLRQVQPGLYTGAVRFTMSGVWTATVTATRKAARARQTFSVAVE